MSIPTLERLRYIKEVGISKLKSKNKLTLVNLKNDYKMYVKTDDLGISRQLIVNKIREKLATEYYKNTLKEGMIILELGANIGYYTILSLKKKDCEVICFEPLKENLELLTKNVEINGYRNRVKIYPFAVGEKQGYKKFYVSNMLNAGSFVNKGINEKEVREVMTIVPDNFLKCNKIDYIRMDIEGYEVRVIKGIRKILTELKPSYLFIEIHPIEIVKLGSSIKEFIKEILDYGYKIERAFYEGSSPILPKKNYIYTNYKSYKENPDFEKRSAQVFFRRVEDD